MINLTLEVQSNKDLLNFFETEEIIVSKTAVTTPDGSQFLIEDSHTLVGCTESTILIDIIISLSTGVTSSIIATWLYSKIKNTNTKIKYNRKYINLDKDSITVLIEEISSEK